MTRTCILLLVCFLAAPRTVAAQDSLSLEAQFALLEKEMDSLNLFVLIDSVLASSDLRWSELHCRVGYNNNVLSAGRNFGINQHGISPAISFYHTSGFFADVSGYWNSAFEPAYNMTITSAGYLKTWKNKWSLSGNLEKWLYHQNSADAYSQAPTMSAGINSSYTRKHGYFFIDYSYLFGNEASAHRLIGNVTGIFQLKKTGFFSSVRFLPSASAIFGNQEIIIRFDGNLIEAFRSRQLLEAGIDREALRNLLTEEEKATVDWINRQLARAQCRSGACQNLRQLRTEIYLSNPAVQDYIYEQLSEVSNAYGLMNYSFSLPVIATWRLFSVSVSYTLSIPVPLPGESEMDPISYFGASVSYRIPFVGIR